MLILFIIFSQIASVKITKVYTDTIIFPNVIIYTSVLNAQGYPITSLSPEDFIIYEDTKRCGPPDSVLPFPKDSVSFSLFLIDVSKNMNPRDIRLVEMILWKVYKQRADKERIGIVLFADTLIPLFNPDEKIDTQKAIGKFNQIRNKLKLREAKLIDIVAAAISKFESEIKGYPLSVILVFSKGIDNGSKASLKDIKGLSIKTQIPVITVGINENGKLLSQLADTVDGEHITGKTANEIELAFDRVNLRVRNSMLLLYKTRNLPGNGMPHTIEVMAQNIKGERIFITPLKRVFRSKTSFFITLGFAIALIVAFVIYNRSKISKRKQRRLKEGIREPYIEEEVVEEKHIPTERLEEAERVKAKKEKTEIFYPYVTMEVKKYGGKENIIYKNKQYTTDTRIEIDYNKVISIGSADTNDLVLPGIYSNHLTLKYEYSRLIINAIAETYINGQEVNGKVRYDQKGKYIINVGQYVLIIKLE